MAIWMGSAERQASSVAWRQAAAAAACYLVVALLFLSPLLPRFDRELINGDGPLWDQLQVLWNAWWIGQSLFQGANPYFCDVVFVPDGAPLVFHFFNPVQAGAINLLSRVVPVALAFNLVTVGGFVTAGLGGYVLCRTLTRDHVASLVGGLVFMTSPFIVSKAAAGWMNMLYAGALPLYVASLFARVSSQTAPRSSAWLLAGCTLFLLATGDVTVVLAANVTFVFLLWQVWISSNRLRTLFMLVHRMVPAILVGLPFGIMVAHSVMVYDLSIETAPRLSYVPDVVSYVLPFSETSMYRPLLGRLDLDALVFGDLVRADNACYLGLAVLPLSVAGLWSGRKHPDVRFMALLFVAFLALSFGPKLLFLREIVHLGGVEVRLPFRLWHEIPLLGSIIQPGRYLAITYMAMSVGVALLVAVARSRFHGRFRGVAAAAIAVIVCLDFAFVLKTAPLPTVATPAIDSGVVLDPRMRSGQTMYYQTRHGRPLMGGYLSRRPAAVLQRYHQMPGLNCLFFGDPAADCSRASILETLRAQQVTSVFLEPGDWRGERLQQYGFSRHYADEWTVVWAVPPRAP